jgi:hypothetical protein
LVFTVGWQHYRPVLKRFPQGVIEYSLNLWEPDLALFELVSAEERQAAGKTKGIDGKAVSRPEIGPGLGSRGRLSVRVFLTGIVDRDSAFWSVI